MLKKLSLIVVSLYLSAICTMALAQTTTVKSVNKINPTTVEVRFDGGKRMMLDFYSKNIFRVFQDNSGGIIREPEAKPEAQILVDEPRREVGAIEIAEKNGSTIIRTEQIEILLDKGTATMKVTDLATERVALEQLEPLTISDKSVALKLKATANEYFYGGGVQNGRFSHKGKIIAIENQNSWTDGGVASPTPFFWSTNGYGIMWHTFRKGKYDFGATTDNVVALSHEEGDGDFEGYISRGDINANGLIDAYDVSTAATMLDGGVRGGKHIDGEISISSDKSQYRAGDEVIIKVEGAALAGVNALSFALPYNQQDYEYVGIELVGMLQMENMTNDRLHTSGDKALYPMFVNTGNKPTIEGDATLLVIKFRAKRDIKFNLKATDGFMVDKQLGVKQF